MSKFLFALVFVSITSFGQTTLERGKSLYESTKYKEATETLKLISKTHSDYAAAQFYLGRIAFDQKNYDDATEYFEEATIKNPKSSEYFNWLGNTYGNIAKDANPFKQGLLAPKMKKAWESAIALDSKNLNARIAIIQFYLQAPGFMGGSIDKAVETAKQVTAIKPAEGHWQMGNILLHEKKNTEAESEFQKMVAADPAYNAHLVVYYQGQKQYVKAFDLLEGLIKKNADDYPSIYQIGKTAALSGQRLDQGEECLKKYLKYEPQKNEPNHAGANMRLGQIQEKKAKKTEAKKYFETALKLDPNLKEAKEGLARCTE